ncbi:hypothetical protein FJY84_00215 [Candidatus Bathyarchaeota archaeon]|nr:hypothetical protein [Candidatus Bathyarchaeota archaeon]
MPYIKQEDRLKYEKTLTDLIEILKSQPTDKLDGELNYLLTRILKGVYQPKYFNYNRAMGVLECCKLEFYRRVVAPYEDTKIKESGDV